MVDRPSSCSAMPAHQFRIEIDIRARHDSGREVFPIALFGPCAHLGSLFWMLPQVTHRLVQRTWIIGRNDESGFAGNIDIAGTSAYFTRDHWLAEHCSFKQGNTECFGAQVRR